MNKEELIKKVKEDILNESPSQVTEITTTIKIPTDLYNILMSISEKIDGADLQLILNSTIEGMVNDRYKSYTEELTSSIKKEKIGIDMPNINDLLKGMSPSEDTGKKMVDNLDQIKMMSEAMNGMMETFKKMNKMSEEINKTDILSKEENKDDK